MNCSVGAVAGGSWVPQVHLGQMLAVLVMLPVNVQLCVNVPSSSQGTVGEGPVSVNGLYLSHLGILILKLYRLVSQLASSTANS